MKIAFYSYAFYPLVGGIESVSMVLATEFARLGHEVRVITTTPAAVELDSNLPFPVLRNPSRNELSATIRWSDVYFQNNISLPALWPALVFHKPWVVAHQTWLRAVDGHVDLAARLKLITTRLASASVSISQAMADQFSTKQELIGNSYDATVFREISGISRDRDFIFVGRLVSDKGVDTLLDAFALHVQKHPESHLTVVGGGDDEPVLREQTTRLGLQERVEFAGVKRGEELTRLLNQHRVLVVPSRWEEPYGIVALEGLACGCLVVGSERGGLKDAIGPGGLTFPNGDVAALAAALEKSLVTTRDEAAVRAHLERQSPASVAQAYLEIFQRVARQS
ncbi:MAG: glycosyltransferase family 4 protein [Chthoniobacterales bacterium]